MAIRMVRRPASTYTVYSGKNYYAEDDINLTTSLGTTEQSYPAVLFNLAYGKIIIDDVTYLVSTSDMVMNENVRNYNAVLNTDDFVGLRYAYGDQNGYVKGYGSEVSSTVDGTDFTINNGILVLRGVEGNIDGNGETLHFNDGITSLRYITIYYSVNTSTNTVGITSLASSTGYTQDLITSADGTVSMALYHFQLQNNEISNVKKIVEEIKYFSELSSSELLWSGDITVNTTSLVDIGQIDIKNKLVEIAVTDTSNNVRYFKFKSPNGSIYFNYMPGASNTSNPEIVFVRFYTSSQQLKTQIFKNTYTLGSSGFSTTAYPSHVLSIREIKE